MKSINRSKIFKKNPSVNKDQVKELSVIRKILKEYGVKEAEYNITPPFARRPNRKIDQSEEDPRTIHLRK